MNTRSLCPECKKIIPAHIYEKRGKAMITKTCHEHGEFTEVYWSDWDYLQRARNFWHDGKFIANPEIDKNNPECPFDCGLCNKHQSHTALANIAITNRCDLACWYCFFFAEKQGYVYEPTMNQLRGMVKSLRAELPVPCNAVQLTGGEPTMRPDLLDIIRMCRKGGVEHVQVNTNGINMARDPGLAKRMRQAGCNTLYLSFDGTTSETNPKNHWEIPAAIESCRHDGPGIVLVPTVIRGVNDQEVGPILDFAIDNLDVVRGVNYQPVSFVGSMPRKTREAQRITIPDVIDRLAEHTDDLTRDDFFPVPTVAPITHAVEAFSGTSQYELSAHPACGMATYLFIEDGKLVPITRFVDVPGLMDFLDDHAERLASARFKKLTVATMALKLGKFIDKDKKPSGLNFKKLLADVIIKRSYGAVGELQKRSLFVGMMHFQDLYNYDIERVKRCCIHYAVPDGRIIPFCAFNILPELYRDKIQKQHSVSIKEWEKANGRKLESDRYDRAAFLRAHPALKH